MNVANLENCKELYKLSGWQVEVGFWITTPKHVLDGVEHDEFSYIADYDERREGDIITPAYDLGYLLRKLPDYVKLFRNNHGKYYCAAVTGSWRHPDNRLGEPDTAHEWYIADTPEDAACKLAIQLFKQSILTKP